MNCHGRRALRGLPALAGDGGSLPCCYPVVAAALPRNGTGLHPQSRLHAEPDPASAARLTLPGGAATEFRPRGRCRRVGFAASSLVNRRSMGDPGASARSEDLSAYGWSLARRRLVRALSGSGRVRYVNQSPTKRSRLPYPLSRSLTPIRIRFPVDPMQR